MTLISSELVAVILTKIAECSSLSTCKAKHDDYAVKMELRKSENFN